MTERTETGREDAELCSSDVVMTASELEAWFVREVLPLEAELMQFLQHNWRNKSDIADLRQDVYERVCEAAQKQIPDQTRAFVFRTARNLLIDRVRREHIVPIEAVADLDALGLVMDAPGPERSAIARDELRRLQAALDRLPPRCREAIVLGRIEGLAGHEIAARMGIGEATVSIHLANGIRALVDILYSDPADNRRTQWARRSKRRRMQPKSRRVLRNGCSAARSGTGRTKIRRNSMPGSRNRFLTASPIGD